MLSRLTYNVYLSALSKQALRSIIQQYPDALPTEAIEAFCDIVREPTHATLGKEALQALHRSALHHTISPLLKPLFFDALDSGYTSMRVVAVEAIGSFPSSTHYKKLLQMLQEDPAWVVRQAVLSVLESWALSGWKESEDEEASDLREHLIVALDDPHWRVRNDLARIWLRWSESDPTCVQAHVQSWLKEKDDPVSQGVLHYILYRWSTFEQKDVRKPGEELPAWGARPAHTEAEWWNEDPPVMQVRTSRWTRKESITAREHWLSLMVHYHPNVRRWATQMIGKQGSDVQWLQLLERLDEPRTPFWKESAQKALQELREARREKLLLPVMKRALAEDWDAYSAVFIWGLQQPIERWILDHVELQKCIPDVFCRLSQHPNPSVRMALFQRIQMLHSDVPMDTKSFEWMLTHEEQHPTCRIEWAIALHSRFPNCTQLDMLEPELRVRMWIHLHRSEPPDWSVVEHRELWLRAVQSEHFEVKKAAAHMWSNGYLEMEKDVRLHSLGCALHQDVDPRIREAALTPQYAQNVLAQPQLERSWRVRRRAARWLKLPLSTWLPDESTESSATSKTEPRSSSSVSTALQTESFPIHPSARPLGQTGLNVSPMGISGHYGLSKEGFIQAAEAGVNLFFWEPNYGPQTAFYRSLAPSVKESFVTVCGSFEADPKLILRDIEYALRSQQIEQIKLFLIYWVRDWERLSDEVIELLERCKHEGKIHTYGMSTHQRSLAVRAIQEQWDVVMVRHNAAHRGAEKQIFPMAQEHQTGLLTFNNLIYGRILKPPFEGVSGPPQAIDCYRYSLSQPGVSACFSAPTTLEQLHHNLRILEDPVLSSDARSALQNWGDRVYLENRMFADCIRSRGWET